MAEMKIGPYQLSDWQTHCGWISRDEVIDHYDRYMHPHVIEVQFMRRKRIVPHMCFFKKHIYEWIGDQIFFLWSIILFG